MFDVSFTELMVIGVIALIVIGPERLPKVARTVGHLLGRAQRYVNDVKSDIRREIELDELRKFKSEMETAAQTVHSSLQDTGAALREPAQALRQELDDAAKAATSALSMRTDGAGTPESTPSAEPAAVHPTAAIPPAEGAAHALTADAAAKPTETAVPATPAAAPIATPPAAIPSATPPPAVATASVPHQTAESTPVAAPAASATPATPAAHAAEPAAHPATAPASATAAFPPTEGAAPKSQSTTGTPT
jgi:sec-independent protein translocase protein TatB